MYVAGKSPSGADATLRAYLEREFHAIARAVTAAGEWDPTPAEIAEGVPIVDKHLPPGELRRYGCALDGLADDTAGLVAGLAANSVVYSWLKDWQLRVTSSVELLTRRAILGHGCTSDTGTRGASCIVRDFGGSDPTIRVTGGDAWLDGLDIDNDDQGAGECVKVMGTRFRFGAVSCRKAGGDGVRIGDTEAGASSINANLGRMDHLIVLENAGHGILWDHTNTSTTGSFPAGIPDCNSWAVSHVDARLNGGDGVKLANAIDNTFLNVVAQHNTGYGVHLAQYARGHVMLKAYTELNTGDLPANDGELILDAGADNNIIIGSRSAIVSPLWTDNGAGNLVVFHNASIANGEFSLGKTVNALNPNGSVLFRGYPGASAILAGYVEIREGTGSGGGVDIYVKRNGDTPLRRLELDESGNVVAGNAAVATNATDGFFYAPSCAGPPTGTPTAKTGRIPMVFDSVNETFHYYAGGAWHTLGP